MLFFIFISAPPQGHETVHFVEEYYFSVRHRKILLWRDASDLFLSIIPIIYLLYTERFHSGLKDAEDQKWTTLLIWTIVGAAMALFLMTTWLDKNRT